MMKDMEETFQYVFPPAVEHFFANPHIDGMMSVIEGEPGVGKTLLALRIAQFFSEADKRTLKCHSNVFFIAIEQDLKSIKQTLKSFSRDFGEYAHKRCFYREAKGVWQDPGKPEETENLTIFFQPYEHFTEPEKLVDWIAKELPEIKDECGCDCGLIIVDNANVFVPKTHDEPPEPVVNNPLNRHVLRQIREKIKVPKANVILIVEGHPEQDNPDIEYYSDSVIRLTSERIGFVRNTILEVTKSRHRPTSQGLHSVRISKTEGFKLWPSPESVVAACQRSNRLKSGKEGYYEIFHVPRLSGWKEAFKGLEVLRMGDIILVTGDRHSGKSTVCRQIVDSGDGSLFLSWRDIPRRPQDLQQILLHHSDLTDLPALYRQLLDDENELSSHILQTFSKSGRELVRDIRDACCSQEKQTPGLPYSDKVDLCKELARELNEKIICGAKNLHSLPIVEKYLKDELEDIVRGISIGNNRVSLVNRLLLEKIFSRKIKRMRKTICFPSEPEWSRNRLFFEIFTAIKKELSTTESLRVGGDGVVGLDDLLYLQDSFPSIKDDSSFVVNLFNLLRKFGLTVVTSATLGAYRFCEQAENLADIIIEIHQIASDGGKLGAIQIHTRDYRGIHPDRKIGFDVMRGELCPESLETFQITPDGKASRVSATIWLPYRVPAESRHALRLFDDVAGTLGHKHVELVGLSKWSESRSIESNSFEVSDLRNREEAMHSPHQYRRPRKKLGWYDALGELERLSKYPHDDLNILAVDDIFLRVGSGHERIAHLLEPLGTIDEWEKRLNVSREGSLLLDFITNIDRQVVAVPYMIDIGVLACYEESSGSRSPVEGFKPETRRLSLTNISQFLKIITTRYEGKTAPYLSFTKSGLETYVFFLWEFLEAVRRPNEPLPEENLFTPEYWDRLDSLRKLLIGGSRYYDHSQWNDKGACWRSWYSRLSNIWNCQSYLELRKKNVDVYPITNKRNIVSIVYFVIPRRAACVGLGKNLIQQMCNKQYAIERLEGLVGLSPYKEHYARLAPDEEISVLLPDEVTKLFEDCEQEHFRSDDTRRFITREQLWPEYFEIHRSVAKRVQLALLSDSRSEMERLLRNAENIVKGHLMKIERLTKTVSKD